MVIDVWNMGEVFITGHVSNKTHVFISPKSFQYPRNIPLKLMTHIIKLYISGKMTCKDI